MAETNTGAHKPIRPAASLLLIRDGQDGLEVLTLKRSETMRFLPGFLAFPGGAVDAADFELAERCIDGGIVAATSPDDAGFALAAVRECAEETGWLCPLRPHGARQLSESEQSGLLFGQLSVEAVLRASHSVIDGSRLRFVGRWVTPAYMPARFDTRFFLTIAEPSIEGVRLSGAENEWGRWCTPGELLERIARGGEQAVPPTIAMLEGMQTLGSAELCYRQLHVPGPQSE